MPFDKKFDRTVYDVSEHTLYRFAELEISRTISQLMMFYRQSVAPRDRATDEIFRSIAPYAHNIPENAKLFHEAMNNHNTIRPPKTQLIHYMLYFQQSYGTIRNLLAVSFNTISANKFAIPPYYPIYTKWTPEMLNNWNLVKTTFNIWNEDTIGKME